MIEVQMNRGAQLRMVKQRHSIMLLITMQQHKDSRECNMKVTTKMKTI